MELVTTARKGPAPVVSQAAAGPVMDVYATLVSGLERQFGQGAGEALAQRFIDAEETDFLWEARRCERWLGGFETADAVADDGGDDGCDDGWGSAPDTELERIAVMGKLGRRWYVATLIVDGEGSAHGLIARREFSRSDRARRALQHLR